MDAKYSPLGEQSLVIFPSFTFYARKQAKRPVPHPNDSNSNYHHSATQQILLPLAIR